MSALSVLAYVVLALAFLTALLLVSWLRFEGLWDASAARLRVRWTLIRLEVDGRARNFNVAISGRRLWTRAIFGARRPTRREGVDSEDRTVTANAKKQKPGHDTTSSGASFGVPSLLFYRRLALDLISRVRVDRFEGHLRIATPDPALTGIAYGAACSVFYPLAARSRRVELDLQPDFVDALPSGRIDFELRVQLASLAFLGWRVLRYERSRRPRRASRRRKE